METAFADAKAACLGGSSKAGLGASIDCGPVLEFLNNLQGLGTASENTVRTGPPGYIGWWN